MEIWGFDINSKSIISSNIIKEFRPGLFLSAILQGESLILKNLTNLPTKVFERFNELFSEHNLTLNDDIYKMFKRINSFGSNVNVFATCNPDSATNLSENVLSRFTVIYISSYKPEEQEIALNNYITMKHLLYRFVLGLLEKRKQNNDKLLAIFTKLHLPLPEQIKTLIEQNPFVVTQQNGYKGVKSNITGYFINSATVLDDGHNQQIFVLLKCFRKFLMYCI